MGMGLVAAFPRVASGIESKPSSSDSGGTHHGAASMSPSAARMKIVITAHVVDQYLRRVSAERSYADTRDYLEAAAEQAVRLPEPTPLGQEQWAIDDAVLVVKYDPHLRGNVAVTVLVPRSFLPSPLMLDDLVRNEFAAAGGEEVSMPLAKEVAPPPRTRTRTPPRPRPSPAPAPVTPEPHLNLDPTTAASLAGPGPVLPMASIGEAERWLAQTRRRLQAIEALPESSTAAAAVRRLLSRIRHVETWAAGGLAKM